jgi:hypothetical protein
MLKEETGKNIFEDLDGMGAGLGVGDAGKKSTPDKKVEQPDTRGFLSKLFS